MPSTTSSAAFVTYSCARWIGLRVWNPTTRFQPRSANAARVCSGSSASSGKAGSGRSNTVISPARYWPGWPYRRATPGCASSVVRKHSSASCFAS